MEERYIRIMDGVYEERDTMSGYGEQGMSSGHEERDTSSRV